MSEEGDTKLQSMVPNIDTLPLDIQRKIIGPLSLKNRCNVRRVNKAMEQAVASTDWRCLGIAHLEVAMSSNEEDTEVKLGWRRLFASMRGSWLDIDKIPSDDPRFGAIYDFIDSCRFDDLNIQFAPGQPLDRYRELIESNKRVTLKHSHFSEEEYLSLTKPVTFMCDSFLQDGVANDELLLTVLQRGHSIVRTKVNPQSVKTIVAAIEIVMKSPLRQELYIDTPLSIAEEFVRLTFDDLVAQRTTIDVPGSRTRLYRYLRRANVGLHEVQQPTAAHYTRGSFHVASSSKSGRCAVEEENDSDDEGGEGEYYDVSD